MGELETIVSAIDARLEKLRIELNLLTKVRDLYTSGSNGSAPPAGPRSTGANEAKRERMTPNTSKPNGATEMILSVVRAEPGLTASKMIDTVIARGLNTSSNNPRRAIAQTANTLIKNKRLARRDGRYFLAE